MHLNRWEIKDRLGHGALTEIADDLNVSVSLVSAVLHGKRTNERVQWAIASRAGLQREEAFPAEKRSAA